MSFCDNSSFIFHPSTPLNNFSSETAQPIFFKFLLEPSVNGGLKIYTNGLVTLIKMATLKNLLQNQESFKAEYWFIVSGPQVCSNDDPRMTFDLFTARSNLHPYAFVWGKYRKFSFLKCIKDQWLKLTMYDQSSKPFELLSKFCSPRLSALAPGLYTGIKPCNL